MIREVLSGEILLARTLLSSSQEDLSALLCEVKSWLEVPVTGIISDGQLSLRAAVSRAFPESAHQLCHFHYLREAGKPLYEADRHAKNDWCQGWRMRGWQVDEQGWKQKDIALPLA